MAVKAVIFDLIQTLTDPDSDKKLHMKIVDTLLKRFNLVGENIISKTEKFNSILKRYYEWAVHGGSFDIKYVLSSTLEEFLKEFGIKPSEEDRAFFFKIYWDIHTNNLEPRPDLIETIVGLRTKKYRIALLSDDVLDYVYRVLKKFRILDLFDVISSSEEIGKMKPHPDTFKLVLNRLGCSSQDAIMVGDSLERDIRGAKALGMRTVLIKKYPNERIRIRELPEDVRPDYVISNLIDLLRII
ncbi:MAG: HAD family hydrolase [Candidatus Asgardarchaeia archaeon]